MKSKASIAIIGAGIIGASIAFNLGKKGIKDVAVFDKSTPGSGSTSAALGGFRSQFSNELSIQLSQRSVAILERFEELTGYDPLISYDGYAFIASTDSSFERLKVAWELQSKFGVPVDLLMKGELQRRFPFYDFSNFIGGTFSARDGHASTLAVLQGYLSKAKELGVDFYESIEVTTVEKQGGTGFLIQTSKDQVTADSVVISAGAYSGRVGKLASVEIPIEPYPRKILVTRSFSDGIPVSIPLIIDVDSTFAFGREGKGLIFADNRELGPSFDLTFPPDYDEDLLRIAIRRVPALSNAELAFSHAGLYEMTPDANPIVCEIPNAKGLYCCAGFAGHGFMHAPAIGEIMADLIEGKRPALDISSFHIERFRGKFQSKEKMII